jgi:ubiquinone/menaquinone biosynthesis C-methylase UbiE
MYHRPRPPTVPAMTTIADDPTAPVGAGPWARVFAAVYDPVLWAGERAGMRARRRELLALARGRTLELGAGTGLNLPHYPGAVDELVLTEPAAPMRERLRGAVRRSGRAATILDAAAERLPLDDGSVDTVVSTLVLCSVEQPVAVLDEISRVLAPGGQLLFLEHVRSDSARLAAWQDRLETPWRRFAEGCRPNRATVELIEAAGFEVRHRRDETWRAMPAIVRPVVSGSATRPVGA